MPNDRRETSRRKLQIFAFDPMVDRFAEPIVSDVPFERVRPGPIGRLVRVEDYDSSTDTWGEPLDLNEPDLLITQGLVPSESDPRFRKQMVYAVAMRVLEAFERGLGRPIVWDRLEKLTLVPHAFRDPNAYFHPDLFAVLFGYFLADADSPGANLPGQQIFTCAAYDVLAHELCHPPMWRLRPYDMDGTGLDTMAFHEGVADLLALLLRFREPGVVERTIATHGAAIIGSPLLSFAPQFSQAAAMGLSLRSFTDAPDPSRYLTETESHARGMLLASAVVEAVIATYREQTADLLRMSGGEPTPGNVHPDLVRRLSDEATSIAADVTQVIIAAFDYLPPFEPRFHDFLRAMITVDLLLFGRTHQRFRALLVEAFHRRGLVSSAAQSLAVDALVLQRVSPLIDELLPHTGDALLHTVTALEWRRQYTGDSARVDAIADSLTREQRTRTRVWLPAIEDFAQRHATVLGLRRGGRVTATGLVGSNQIDSGGNLVSRVFVSVVQLGNKHAGNKPVGNKPVGATLVCDSDGDIQYVIGSNPRVPRQARPTVGSNEPTPEQQRLAGRLRRAVNGMI